MGSRAISALLFYGIDSYQSKAIKEAKLKMPYSSISTSGLNCKGETKNSEYSPSTLLRIEIQESE